MSQTRHHLFTVMRYVERNPVRAGLCERAEDWPYSSARLWLGEGSGSFSGGPALSMLRPKGSMPEKVPDPFASAEERVFEPEVLPLGARLPLVDVPHGFDSPRLWPAEAKGSGTFSPPVLRMPSSMMNADGSQPATPSSGEKGPDPSVVEGKGLGTFSPREAHELVAAEAVSRADAASRDEAAKKSQTPVVDPSLLPWLVEGPIRRHWPWLEFVNRVESQAELLLLRESVNRGTPFGDADWQKATGAVLGQESTMRPRGRPRKK